MIAHARVLRAKGHYETSLIDAKKGSALLQRPWDRPGRRQRGHPERESRRSLLEFLLSSQKKKG